MNWLLTFIPYGYELNQSVSAILAKSRKDRAGATSLPWKNPLPCCYYTPDHIQLMCFFLCYSISMRAPFAGILQKCGLSLSRYLIFPPRKQTCGKRRFSHWSLMPPSNGPNEETRVQDIRARRKLIPSRLRLLLIQRGRSSIFQNLFPGISMTRNCLMILGSSFPTTPREIWGIWEPISQFRISHPSYMP